MVPEDVGAGARHPCLTIPPLLCFTPWSAEALCFLKQSWKNAPLGVGDLLLLRKFHKTVDTSDPHLLS
jgi:hypothetical protein